MATQEQRRQQSLRMKEHWQSLTPEQREKRLENLRKVKHERSAEWRRKKSEEVKKAWKGYIFKPRECRHCGNTFTPNSGPQVYCSHQCKKDHRPYKTYELSPGEYERMYQQQNGCCALCGSDYYGFGAKRSSRPLVVDHCHHTGKVRALLCSDCNTALGRFGDDPERLRAAVDYLERYTQRPSR